MMYCGDVLVSARMPQPLRLSNLLARFRATTTAAGTVQYYSSGSIAYFYFTQS
jgi:hypothetical protein